MPRITRSALVMFSAEQMFRLVNDVHAYPEFLPGCVGSRVHETGDDYMTASVDVAKAGIAKTFTTRNLLDANRQIKMELVEGPSASWRAGGPSRRWTWMPARWSSISTSSSPPSSSSWPSARSSAIW